MTVHQLFKKCTLSAIAFMIAAVLFTFSTASSGSTAWAAEQGVAQPYESLFEGDQMIDVNVTIGDEDWKSILESPLDKEYKNVTVEVDGNVVNNVGFSTKGNLTLNAVASMTDSDRYSFRLKFDKYDKSQTLLGLDKMVLNNSYADPSFLREYLHYEALRAIGLDAPLTVFTNLYINGELYGFYVGVEAIDDSYMERNFGEGYEDGVLYDTDEKSYLQYAENSSYDSLTYELGTEDEKASLKKFISVLNAMPDGQKGDIEDVLDVSTGLKYIAANAVLGNYDSYNGDKGHNFMLYGDASGKYSVLPWDFNMSFNGYSGGGRGTSSATGSTVNTNAATASVDVPVLGINMESVPLINNLLKVDEYKEQYLTYVTELVDYLEGIENRITELSDLIRPSVQADPTKFYTMEQFESNIAYSSVEESNVGGMGGSAPADGQTPPTGTEGPPPTRPDNSQQPTEPPAGAAPGANGGAAGQGNGMGNMAAGSLMTFALNRLNNLQTQLDLTVTALPTDKEISVIIDGTKVNFSQQEPLIRSGRVLVPIRGIFEALGADLKWDNAAKTITAIKDNRIIVLTIGSSTAYVNGVAVTLEAAPTILNARTVVPLRFIADSLNKETNWNSATSTVTINSAA
ncbi:CotH kinase family protein [Paenibacillus paridis]|uniref:CotH kinase family protein n=1 Tax=Paenibacillus paridis TaxID=2583376 RepID=UPI001EE462CD|nr:CotH kinase family protein [Paenibacillus paridis]